MSTSLSRASATIYTFPLRGRFARPEHQENSAPATNQATNHQLPRGVKIESGSGWYHEEAIRAAVEAERGRKN